VTAAPALASAVKVKVTVFNGKTPGQALVFDKPVVTVGRGPENDVVFGNDARMSRNHLEIRWSDGKLTVRNLSQKNFILVNGERTEEMALDGLALIQAGDTTLQVQVEDALKPGPILESLQLESNAERTMVVKTERPPVASPPRTPPPAPASRHQNVSTPPTPSFHSSASSSRNHSAPPPRSVSAGSRSSGSRLRFYMIIAIVGGGLFWLLNSDPSKKKREVNIRTDGDVTRAIEESARAVQEIQKQQSSTGQDSVQYKAAQEHYIRGFRDYRQGQYARSIQSFQAALSFYPNHELARKYYVQAQRKFEAQIDFELSQGRKYYQKNNYKMCQSSFASVMIMVKDSSKPKYKEAKQFYDECSLRLEGRI
jgi:hypothetical protein